MSGITVRLFTISLLLMAGGMRVSAETPSATESVTVSGTRMREGFQDFLRGFVAPAARTGKLARWERRICPAVTGQDSHAATFIMQRIKFVALAAGAPVSTDPSCTPNIEVIFTTTPQELLDNVRRHDVNYLGFAESNAELEKLAKVTHPVQAWYMTETVDARGRHRIDSAILANTGGGLLFDPDVFASTGSRINNGIKTGFYHVLIVVDSTKLAGQEIVPLADYISMLALSQINASQGCPQLSSIVDILAEGCDQKVDGLTKYDLAYLQSLYWMSASRGLMFQRNDIAAMMTDRLRPEK